MTLRVPSLSDNADITAAVGNLAADVQAALDSKVTSDSGTGFVRGKTTISNVAGVVASVGKVYVQATQPTGAVAGDIWMW